MKKTLCTLLVALSVTASQAQACMGEKMHDRMEKMAMKLDLSKEQRDQIKAAHDEAKKQVMPLRGQLKDVHHNINEAFKTNSMTSSKENSFVREEKDIIGSMLKVKMDERMKINHILTDSQRVKFSEMMENWKKEHHEKMKNKHH